MQKPASRVRGASGDGRGSMRAHVGRMSGGMSAHVGGLRRHAAARAVGSYVPGLTRKAFEKYGFSAATLITDWAQIVGAEIAAVTRPERLKWPKNAEESEACGRRSATLVLSADPAVALEIQYKIQQVIERVNAYFGYRAVGDARLIQRHAETSPHSPVRAVAPASPPPQVADIADESLRAALSRLHAGVASRARAS